MERICSLLCGCLLQTYVVTEYILQIVEIIKTPKMTYCIYKLAYEKGFVTFGASFLVEIYFK